MKLPPDEGGIAFVAQLRQARAAAHADSEDAAELFVAFERLGFHLARPKGKPHGLYDYKKQLLGVCRSSEFCAALERSPGESTAADLFESLVAGRNERMHVGIAARRVVAHAVRFALMLEAGLMSNFESAAHFMVRGPTCVEAWQTFAQVRQTMLTNQFSVLPYRSVDRTWVLLGDLDVARYLHDASDRQAALVAKVGEVLPRWKTSDFSTADFVGPTWKVDPAKLKGAVVLVTDTGKSQGELLGIITPFDLL
jgi:hypothetical protein